MKLETRGSENHVQASNDHRRASRAKKGRLSHMRWSINTIPGLECTYHSGAVPNMRNF